MAFFRALSSLASSAVSKSPLAVLRKRTGFPIGKCKDALQRHENDLGLAEKWMKEQALKEGWAKAEKLAERATHQGLIGVVARANQAAIVEVRLNCRHFLSFIQIFTRSIVKLILYQETKGFDHLSLKW